MKDRAKRNLGLSLLLSFVLLFSGMPCMTAYAVEANDAAATADVTDATRGTDTTDPVEGSDAAGAADAVDDLDSTEATEGSEATEAVEASDESGVTVVTSYEEFLASLKVIEQYASDYATLNSLDANELVINYIRTGIEKYNTESWAILAGSENTAFVSYVVEQDAANGTNAQGLRGIGTFATPNGQTVEFAHMFGAMNIAYYNSNAQTSADFGSWAGDICDLMGYSKSKVTSTDVEAMAQEIGTYYLGVDEDGVDESGENIHTFGYLDIYADLDSYYFMSKLSGSTTLSSLMESYYTSSLSDVDRATYFLTNRFAGSVTQEAVRESIYTAYAENSGAGLLEAERGLTDDSDLRTACCYAFADYLYDLAKDQLAAAEPENPYYTVFDSETSTLAPGVEQNISYALTADEKQIVFYTATVDISRDDVNVYANYKDNDGSTWGMQRVTDQMAAAEANHADIENYTPVVGVNGDFYNMTTGAPAGALVMEGTEYHGVGSENFFAILDDGTAMIGGTSEYAQYKDRIVEAVGGSNIMIKNGEITVSTSSDYYNSRASRTCVGITADGKVVLMVLDGRQFPFSVGGSLEEIAQIMLEAGCVTAMNLDGGGSTTYAAKLEGADEVTVVNRPSDGYERSVSSSLMVVSTAKSSTEFDHALVSTSADYLTVGATVDVSALGVSVSGCSADLPEGATLTVSDESVATLQDGVLTGVALGSVTINLELDGAVLGSKTVQVVEPDNLYFTRDSMNAVYGSEVALPIEASYNGNPVAICANDVTFELSTATAGTIEDFTFVGDETSGVRNVTVTAMLTKDYSISDTMTIALYKNGEAIFDFDTAMAGDDSFAWNRDVSNSTTTDEVYYHVGDPTQPMDISYIFALDMTAVPVPEKIKPLLGLVAGGDVENVRAWDLLLQLAERVGTMTTVTVNLNVDPNLDIDCSGLTLVNEYFTLTSTEFNKETHTLTVTFNWNKQTAAIEADTANPICILSGIKATPKDNAAWDENSCLAITNSGDLSYDIYLRSSTLYNVASQTSTQEIYDIYPYINPDNESEKGGHFATTYKTFEDTFTLDKSIWQGWKQAGDDLYYYVDNVAVTGTQILPSYEDESVSLAYSFDENGVCQGTVTGLFEVEGELYYAVNGSIMTGWRMVTVDGADKYYYFDKNTGKAVDGKQTIDGYHYTFTDCVLTRGDLVKTDNGLLHYKWAGEWVMNSWVEIDGNKYYAGKQPYGYFVTDLHTRIHKYGSDTEMSLCLFDQETAVWQENYSGLYTDENGEIYLIEGGYVLGGVGLVQIDGDYYYFKSSTGTAVKNRTYWITMTNGLLPSGEYTFDATGKMVNPPSVEPEPDPEPDPEPTPEPEVKDGIVEENGSLYYYVDGVLTPADLIQIEGDYYYVKTSTGEVVHGRTYWITVTNDLLPSGQYTFDETGKMINLPTTVEPEPDPEPDPEPTPEPEVKDGIVEENGSLYYYVDGVLTRAGLIQIDGDYYYVKTSSGEVVHGRTYWITVTNNLLPSGIYTFGDDGKMVVSEA